MDQNEERHRAIKEMQYFDALPPLLQRFLDEQSPVNIDPEEIYWMWQTNERNTTHTLRTLKSMIQMTTPRHNAG